MLVDRTRHTGGEVEGRKLHEWLDVAAQRHARAGDTQRAAGEPMLLQEVRDGAVRHLGAGSAIVVYGLRSERRIEDAHDVARVGYEGRRQAAEQQRVEPPDDVADPDTEFRVVKVLCVIARNDGGDLLTADPVGTWRAHGRRSGVEGRGIDGCRAKEGIS